MRPTAVDLQVVEPGIAQVTMQDRINKNTFSKELIQGLVQSFEKIRDDTAIKTVILTGYDTYFASGGTQEGLLAIYEGKTEFNQVAIYSLPLECPVPVIAAMQGHGIGGGFVLGLFCDFVILSRESVYTTNFMKYGFTPGFGSTYILSQKMGLGLAEELLITAANYRGAELEKRGISFPVLPRLEVPDYALQLARQVAEKPRISLTTLKAHLVAHLRQQLPAIIEKEVAMHEKTFHQPEVKERIMTLFGR
jgi:polyketide biosynthesis enoyl-CoA hydratase PksI